MGFLTTLLCCFINRSIRITICVYSHHCGHRDESTRLGFIGIPKSRDIQRKEKGMGFRRIGFENVVRSFGVVGMVGYRFGSVATDVKDGVAQWEITIGASCFRYRLGLRHRSRPVMVCLQHASGCCQLFSTDMFNDSFARPSTYGNNGMPIRMVRTPARSACSVRQSIVETLTEDNVGWTGTESTIDSAKRSYRRSRFPCPG